MDSDRTGTRHGLSERDLGLICVFFSVYSYQHRVKGWRHRQQTTGTKSSYERGLGYLVTLALMCHSLSVLSPMKNTFADRPVRVHGGAQLALRRALVLASSAASSNRPMPSVRRFPALPRRRRRPPPMLPTHARHARSARHDRDNAQQHQHCRAKLEGKLDVNVLKY